jgi:biotin carboxylase
MTKIKDYYWVIGGGAMQIPLIEEAKKFGFKIIVSDLSSNCICKPFADIFFNIDIFDINLHIKKADEVISFGNKIVGVLAAGIDAPETMASLSLYLKLPTVDPKIANLVHNKHLFREKLRELGYPTPKFRKIDLNSVNKLKDFIAEIQFPLIVKNSDSSGSRGTKIFYKDNYDDILNIVKEAIKVSKSGIALIEECWEGKEQTVETIFDINGVFHPCFITDRIFDRSSGFAIELGLRSPSILNTEIQKEMFQLAKDISIDLGIDKGAAKFDMILTKNGPRVIEMTVRLSGGFDCQYLVPAASGKNILKTAILTSIGKTFSPDLLKDKKNRVALSESIWPKPGIIKTIAGLEKVKNFKGFEFMLFRSKVGDLVEKYTDCTKRVCFIIASGRNYEEARENIDKIKNEITIELD